MVLVRSVGVFILRNTRLAFPSRVVGLAVWSMTHTSLVDPAARRWEEVGSMSAFHARRRERFRRRFSFVIVSTAVLTRIESHTPVVLAMRRACWSNTSRNGASGAASTCMWCGRPMPDPSVLLSPRSDASAAVRMSCAMDSASPVVGPAEPRQMCRSKPMVLAETDSPTSATVRGAPALLLASCQLCMPRRGGSSQRTAAARHDGNVPGSTAGAGSVRSACLPLRSRTSMAAALVPAEAARTSARAALKTEAMRGSGLRPGPTQFPPTARGMAVAVATRFQPRAASMRPVSLAVHRAETASPAAVYPDMPYFDRHVRTVVFCARTEHAEMSGAVTASMSASWEWTTGDCAKDSESASSPSQVRISWTHFSSSDSNPHGRMLLRIVTNAAATRGSFGRHTRWTWSRVWAPSDLGTIASTLVSTT